MRESLTRWLRGTAPLLAGVESPKSFASRPAANGILAVAVAVATSGGCAADADNHAYDPVALGMLSSNAPLYDDGETTIYQVKRAVSLPILTPTPADQARLATALAPYARTPWITKNDVKVQVSWTLTNLDKEAHNVEVLLDPWNEFARYVPGVTVGEEETVPDLSGIDILMRVEGKSRKNGTFTFDDMDEVATDLATVQNILATTPTMGDEAEGVNGLVNHAFEIHNRSTDNDRLIHAYIPPTIAGLVGFDIGLRLHESGTVAIEIFVEIKDVAGNRVNPDGTLNLDGAMWITPDADLSAPAGEAR